jgi:hypothetical protein
MPVSPEFTDPFCSFRSAIGSRLALCPHHVLHSPAQHALQVWFWRFRREHRPAVLAKLAVEKEARQRLRELLKQREKIFSDAKASLGVWSQVGVDESRRVFWCAPGALCSAPSLTPWMRGFGRA